MQSFLLKNSVMVASGKDDFGYYDPRVRKMLAALPEPKPVDEVLLDAKYGASRSAEYSNSGIRFIRAQSIREWGIDDENECYFQEEDYEDLKRYLLREGDVVFTRSGVNVGDAATITSNYKDSVYGSYSIRLRFNKEVLPEFMAIIFNSRIGKMQVGILSTRSAQPNINIKEIRSLIIPKLTTNRQEKVIETMQDAYETRKRLLSEVGDTLSSFDSYLRMKLGIESQKIEDVPRFHINSSSLLKRHDVEFFQPKHFSLQNLLKLKGAQPLGDLADFTRENRNPTANPLAVFDYVDIASIDIRLGMITTPREVVGEFAPSRARKVIHKGNIVVSTVRPTRGAIAVVPVDLDDQICSTGFAVLQPRSNVEPLYLHSVLRSSIVRQQFERISTGASYPAIVESDMKRVLLPFPDENIQREISRESAQRNQEALDKLAEAEKQLREAKRKVEYMIFGENFRFDDTPENNMAVFAPLPNKEKRVEVSSSQPAH